SARMLSSTTILRRDVSECTVRTAELFLGASVEPREEKHLSTAFLPSRCTCNQCSRTDLGAVTSFNYEIFESHEGRWPAGDRGKLTHAGLSAGSQRGGLERFVSPGDGRDDLWDRLKCIGLGRPFWYVSFGAELRGSYEIYRTYNWGSGPQDCNGCY